MNWGPKFILQSGSVISDFSRVFMKITLLSLLMEKKSGTWQKIRRPRWEGGLSNIRTKRPGGKGGVQYRDCTAPPFASFFGTHTHTITLPHSQMHTRIHKHMRKWNKFTQGHLDGGTWSCKLIHTHSLSLSHLQVHRDTHTCTNTHTYIVSQTETSAKGQIRMLETCWLRMQLKPSFWWIHARTQASARAHTHTHKRAHTHTHTHARSGANNLTLGQLKLNSLIAYYQLHITSKDSLPIRIYSQKNLAYSPGAGFSRKKSCLRPGCRIMSKNILPAAHKLLPAVHQNLACSINTHIGDHYWSSPWFSNKQHYLSKHTHQHLTRSIVAAFARY